MMRSGQVIRMGSGQVWLGDVALDGIGQTCEPDLRAVASSGPAA